MKVCVKIFLKVDFFLPGRNFFLGTLGASADPRPGDLEPLLEAGDGHGLGGVRALVG